MRPEIKKWIDEASYEEMLRKVRFEPAGSEYFVLGTGKYFAVVMTEKRDKLPEGEYVKISKRIGWKQNHI